MSSRRVRLLLTLGFVLLAAVLIGWWPKTGPSSTRQASAPKASTESIVVDPSAADTASNTSTAGPNTSTDPAAPVADTADAARPDSQGQAPAPAAAVAPTNTPAVDDTPQPSTRALASKGKSVVSILEGADLTDPDIRAAKVAEVRELEEAQQNAVVAKANELGIPLRVDGPNHKVSTLFDIRGNKPLYRTTLNANAAISTGANLLAPSPYSLNGSGVKVGVWDGGWALTTHQELTGRVTKGDPGELGFTNDDHATHVSGTIGASGVQAAAKGMSPQTTIVSYCWNNDYSEMMAAAATGAGDITNIPLSNHSYGYNATTSDMGRYESEAAAVDAVAAGLPYYLVFWAAGNEQDSLTAHGGFQSITYNALAKNVMTIGAADDAVTSGVRDPSKAVIAYFSSLGPCDDGRIKPDVVANGVNLYSSVATSNTSYDGTYSGTSMATPNAMGSTILLEQLYAREFSNQRMRASMIKALLIHTATDRGNPGPDYKYGWGLLDVKSAADLILAHKASPSAPKMIEGSLTNAANTATHTFTWDGSSPIRATLCWTDPAGTAQTAADSRTPNLKHNLDVKITAPNGTTVYSPYVMPFVGTWTEASMNSNATTGKNNVDTVEQVYLATPTQAGTYTVTVSVDGSLTTASQAYSLIITGRSNNPSPVVSITQPVNGQVFAPNATVAVQVAASDLTAAGAAGVISQVQLFDNDVVVGTDNSAPYAFSITPALGSHTLVAKATDSEGATGTSASIAVSVVNQPPAITAASLSSSGQAYTDVPLTVSSVTASDPEGTALTYAYQWQSSTNQTSYANIAGATTLTAPALAGNLLRCVITASDGVNTSAPFTTSAVNLLARPVASAVLGSVYSYTSGLVLRGSSSQTATAEPKALTPGITFTNGGYNQNFDTTPGASLTTYPSGWSSFNNTTEDSAMTVGTSSSTAGANYNYGSKIGVLGSNGGFDPSSIVLAIANTTGVSALKISYNVIKIREQGRSCSFDLEYSTTSPTSGFSAVPGGAYVSGSITQGTSTSYTNLALPSAIENLSSTVYLRWKYATISGSGSRDGVALDDVVISSGGPALFRIGSGAVIPTGLTLNSSTGTLSGTIAPGNALGNYPIVIERYNSLGESVSQSFTLTLTAAAGGFEAWISSYSVGGQAGPKDDYDKDGLPNLIENFLGTAPDVPNVGLTPMSATATTLVFRHSRSNTIASDITPSYEWSANLSSWQASGASSGGVTVTMVPAVIIDNTAPANDTVEVTATVTGTPASDVFVRLKAEK